MSATERMEYVALVSPGWSEPVRVKALWEVEVEVVKRHSVVPDAILWQPPGDEDVVHMALRPPTVWDAALSRPVMTYEDVPVRWVGEVRRRDGGSVTAIFGPKRCGEVESHTADTVTDAWLWLISRIWHRAGYPDGSPAGRAVVEEGAWGGDEIHLKAGLPGTAFRVDGRLTRQDGGWRVELYLPGRDGPWVEETRTRLAALMLFLDRCMQAAADGEFRPGIWADGRYFCQMCGKDLGTPEERRGGDAPDMVETYTGEILCWDCFVRK